MTPTQIENAWEYFFSLITLCIHAQCHLNAYKKKKKTQEVDQNGMVQLQTACSILPFEGLPKKKKKTRGGPKWNDLASNIQKENHGLDFVTIKIEYIGQLRANIKLKQHGLQLLICQMGFRELFLIDYNPHFDRPSHGLQVSPAGLRP